MIPDVTLDLVLSVIEISCRSKHFYVFFLGLKIEMKFRIS